MRFLDHLQVFNHVEQLANRALDEIRQIVQNEEGKRKIHLKEILLKSRERLTEQEQEKLKLAFQKYKDYPVLYEAWFIKEKIRRMYWAKDMETAKRRYEAVLTLLETTHRSRYLKTLRATFKNWEQEILNYFINGTTNGFTEGCNTKIKMQKRVSYGFRNIENYIAKMMLGFIPLLWLINYHTI